MNPVADEVVSRSSGSNRSSQPPSRRQNPQAQLSQIEKSVTHLLVATKQLLETLTDWSRRQANENAVSDVYVRLGYEFNIACRAFNAIGVDTQDLGPVPDLLRTILEETLSQEASQASLDRFLPRIRDIIINLLHGLKKKQQRLRQRAGRGDLQNGTSSRSGSGGSAVGDQADAQGRSTLRMPQRQGSADFVEGAEVPPRTVSSSSSGASTRYDGPASRGNRSTGSTEVTRDSSSSLSSGTLQNIPVIGPYSPEDPATQQPPPPPPPPPYASGHDFPHPPPPPPPEPKQEDALLALQRGGDLERRASRRFSSYQINKQLGLPASQNSPIPNRGRDIRDSVNAARMRNSVLHGRSKSTQPFGSPARPKGISPSRIPEESGEEGTGSQASLVKQPAELESERPRVAELESTPQPELTATLSGPVQEFELSPEPEPSKQPVAEVPARSKSRGGTKSPGAAPASGPFTSEETPPPTKELTLYLKYKSRIKKFVLENGYEELTIPRLQLAFIEKFAWNTHNNGVDLPAIYIEEQGARYELEDLNDVKNHSILALNVEELDEVKRSIDDGLNGLRSMVEGLKSAMEVQQAALQRVSEAQQATARDIAGMAATPPLPGPVANVSPSSSQSGAPRSLSQRESASQLTEVQTLRRDLAVMRQTYSSFLSEVQASMADVRSKAASVKTVAFKAAMSDLEGERGRAYLNEGKKTLADESRKLVDRVDEVQDAIEDLRKDVVIRGVRPLPRQLETVAKDISLATAELKKMQEALKREKPVWTKIWEKELQVVCDERDLLTMQEELSADLEDDLEKAAQTFSLVEQATKQQNLQSGGNGNAGGGGPVRGVNRQVQAMAMDKAVDPRMAKDGVLGEVRALQPNHESRLEAIERAERARQRELANRTDDAFKKELGSFVDEGKLKRSGGVEEAERLRRARDERIRQEVWERQQARATAAAAAAADEAAAPAEGSGGAGGSGSGPGSPDPAAQGVGSGSSSPLPAPAEGTSGA